jgi:hypothetical protein
VSVHHSLWSRFHLRRILAQVEVESNLEPDSCTEALVKRSVVSESLQMTKAQEPDPGLGVSSSWDHQAVRSAERQRVRASAAIFQELMPGV